MGGDGGGGAELGGGVTGGGGRSFWPGAVVGAGSPARSIRRCHVF